MVRILKMHYDVREKFKPYTPKTTP